jgi:hypothetical protein
MYGSLNHERTLNPKHLHDIPDAQEEKHSTVDSPQIGHLQVGKLLKLTDFCGDERVATPLHAVLILREVLKVTGFALIRMMSDLRTVNCML